MGSVIWKKTVTQAPLIGAFQSDTEYTAVLTLTPAPGYTFTGLGQNAFTHADAVAVTNLTGSGTVTINFPPAVFSNYTVTTFGPVGTEGSALKVMMERSDDDRAVTIDLPPGTETVIPDSVNLVGELNSPANVTIDGHGRVLQVLSPGTLLTVSENVTLTLRDLTLQVHLPNDSVNNAPLVTVRPRGRLILDGVTLADNPTTGNTGGVWVNGGALVMNQGSAIKKMTVTIIPSNNNNKAGAVVIDNNGRFTMHGGVIGGDAADGNTVSGCDASGGGVLVLDGVFDMYGGTIGGNTAKSGGGVAVLTGGTFNQYGGTIKENRAESGGGGGVKVGKSNVMDKGGIFIMNGDAAVIEGNSVEDGGGGGGGGVNNLGTFLMSAGTIKENTVGGGGGGVRNSGTFDMYGGTIKRNTAASGGNATLRAGGVYNGSSGIFNMYGGTIGGGPGDANIATGIDGNCIANGVVVDFSRFIMSGGIITGNTDALAVNDYGVWVHALQWVGESADVENFTMSGSAQITADNKVFLYSGSPDSNKSISIGGNLSAPYAANITMKNSPTGTTRLLRASSEDLIMANYDKFLYDGAPEHINSTPVQDGGLWYGTYKP
jgi:hypothetical protein